MEQFGVFIKEYKSKSSQNDLLEELTTSIIDVRADTVKKFYDDFFRKTLKRCCHCQSYIPGKLISSFSFSAFKSVNIFVTNMKIIQQKWVSHSLLTDSFYFIPSKSFPTWAAVGSVTQFRFCTIFGIY